MKLISRIILIMTAVAGVVFVILGICLMGMSGYMTSVVNNAANTTTEIVSTTSVAEIIGSTGDIYIPEAEVLPEYTAEGAMGMLLVGIFLLVYGGACAVISILSLQKLEKAKVKKDIKLFGILSCIFAFVAPGVFLLRLSDDDIRDKQELETRRR